MDVTLNIQESNQLQVDPSQRPSGKAITRIIDDSNFDKYIKNMAYYQGKNTAIVKQGEDNATARKDPNNVIPLPFGRKTVNDLLGYAYKPGNVRYMFDEQEIREEVRARLDGILKYNEDQLESSEIFRDTCIKGEGAELLYWKDEEPNINFVKVPREQCVFEYADTLKENKLEFAIRAYTTIEILPDGKDLIKYIADVYTDQYKHVYEYQETKDLEGREQDSPLKKYTTEKNIEYEYQYSIQHPFGDVPLYPYNINDDKLGVYEASIAIIDKLDGIGSDSIANAIDQFNDTLLTLSKKVDKETADKIKDLKVIDDLGGKDEGNFAEFLQRNLDITGTLESAKLFERWYYDLTQIPNFNDEKFNQKSGIAIAYALVSFENLVTTMETYFTKGLKKRLSLMSNALSEMEGIKDEIKAVVEWRRNLPFDLKERVDIVVALKNSGLVSDETLLKMFPQNIIEDAEAELEKVNEQKQKNAEQFMSQTIPNPEENEEENDK